MCVAQQCPNNGWDAHGRSYMEHGSTRLQQYTVHRVLRVIQFRCNADSNTQSRASGGPGSSEQVYSGTMPSLHSNSKRRGTRRVHACVNKSAQLRGRAHRPAAVNNELSAAHVPTLLTHGENTQRVTEQLLRGEESARALLEQLREVWA